MIDVADWMAHARNGEAVGRCSALRCGGSLFVPRSPLHPDDKYDEWAAAPYTDRPALNGVDTIRWYEADCHTCRAAYAYPDGRTADDANDKTSQKLAQREQSARRDQQRVGEFVGGLLGKDGS